MRQFITRAVQKLTKLTPEQIKTLFLSMGEEIDRLETVLDSLNEGILVCDSDHNLILANKAAERFFPMAVTGGSRPPDANGTRAVFDQGAVWELVHDERTAAFLEQALRSGDRIIDREFDVETKGVRRLLAVSVSPLVKDRHVTGSLIHARDVTEKRSREARMRRMESLASLTTLAAGVAHEIKNPLGSISIHMQLLQKAMRKNEDLYFRAHPGDKDAPDDIGPNSYFKTFNKYTRIINEEIERLNRIVVDFLFAVRPMDLEMREGDINAFLRGVMEFVSFELENAGVTIQMELEEKLPLVDFDDRVLKQAMLNLIQNAVAAMPGGGILRVKTELADGEVVVGVCDSGCGIPEDHLSKIFEPYFTTKESGSGLGLTLVFKIVREHRGEITVKSKEGSGSCFTITLPIPQKERKLLTGGVFAGESV
jgi:signal transduction histidine kinase